MKCFSLIMLSALAVGAQAQTLFYGGDPTGGGLASQVNGNIFADIRTYDDFTLMSNSTITGVFGNFLQSGNFSNRIYWEIRSGVTAGNGGTVVVSPTISNATVVNTGLTSGSYNIFNYESAVTPFELAAGTYYLTVAVYSGSDFAFAARTTGVNGVGSPIGNGNSFLDAWNPSAPGGPNHYTNFEPASNTTLTNPTDFSFGLRGAAVVPEPASLATLGLGAIALIRRRRK